MKRSIILLSLFGASILNAQINDSIPNQEEISLQEVSITEKLPITVEKISNKILQKKNLGQDIPTLLNGATSVITSTEAGNGIGYSTIRIRGLNESSINVTLNGIPLNNAESQGVFWVNMPDLASSTNSMIIQRGVGTSSNGMASFGASVNIESQNPSKDPYAEANLSFGSFNAQKYTIQAGTGKILNNKLSIDGRFSKINSDGFIDRATADLIGYDITALYQINDKTSFRFQNMYGKEKTYQAWNGIDGEAMKRNRRFNSAGAIYNEDWTEVIGYYNNEIDDYQQNHYFLTWNQLYGKGWKSNVTLHYTKGKGYFENYKQDERLSKYKINHLSFTSTDLVRQKFLDNDFYGFNLEVENQQLGDFKVFFGLSGNEYDGDHFGQIKWMKDYNWTDTNYKFYNNNSLKRQLSAYAKVLYQWNQFEFFGDLQYRYVDYEGKYLPNGENDDDDFRPFAATFHFVNPKAGLNYKINANNIFYISYGISQREPLRADYENIGNEPKAEFLQDYELGYRKTGRFSMSANLYYMDYRNQLVPTGRVNDVGTPIRENSGASYRRGIELDASYQLIPSKLNVFGNLTLAQNKNKNFTEEDWVNGGIKSYGKTSIALSPDIISAFGFEVYPAKNLLINFTNKYVGQQYLSNTEPADGKLSDYLVSDLLIRYAPNWFGLKKLELSLLVNNLFDVEYESNGYYYEGPYYFPQAGINVLGGISIRL
ncbi:TonB-dependent receptor [Faecalibacter rhinopitheci]|uniref:TonB-dependent receptor n=1 Tax=Faecalibacter rhinopitheci TaxID=2779678 RepID=A0A8J7G9E0_9FLAO|nr:TonB-dependent receptor [Faecalibacter rhinopitheci]MBF0597875.1 TonB-dependent receptor [Faecalibacter rhinopitheci]